MDRFTQNKLNLNPRSDQELRGVLANFERKWQNKVKHQFDDDLLQS
jgi:hypothetical protein